MIWPGTPYVPGVTPRHPEGLFDSLRDTATPGMEPAVLAACAAWLAGQAYYRAGYFWEAHEVWEPVWLALPPNSPERRMAQAMIQLTNAALKVRMNRPRAALRLCAEVERLCGQVPAMGIAPAWVAGETAALRQVCAVSGGDGTDAPARTGDP